MNRENKKTLQVFEVTESITERGMRSNYPGNKYNKNINNQYNEPRKQENPTSFRSYRKHHRKRYEIELPWKQIYNYLAVCFRQKRKYDHWKSASIKIEI